METIAVAFIALAVIFAVLTIVFAALYVANRAGAEGTAGEPTSTAGGPDFSFEFTSSLSPPQGINAKNFGCFVKYAPSVRAGIVVQIASNGTIFNVPQIYTFTLSETNQMTLGPRLEVPGETDAAYEIFFKAFDNTAWVIIIFGGPAKEAVHRNYNWRFEDGEFKLQSPTAQTSIRRVLGMTVANGITYRAGLDNSGSFLKFNPFDESIQRFSNLIFQQNNNIEAKGTFDADNNFYCLLYNDPNQLRRYAKIPYNADNKNWEAVDGKNQFAFPAVKYPDRINPGQPLSFNYIDRENETLTVNRSGSSFMFSRGGTAETSINVQNITSFHETDGLNFLWRFSVAGRAADAGEIFSGFASITEDFDYYLVPTSSTSTTGHYAIYTLSDATNPTLRTGAPGLPTLIPYTIESIPVNEFFQPLLIKLDNSTLALFCTNNQRLELYTAKI